MRWSLDLAAGLAIVPAERLAAVPVEPTRPVIVVPLAMLDGGEGGPVPPPVPGRHGHPGEGPIALLARLYPTGHPVGRFRRGETSVGAMTDADLGGPLYLAPVAPEAAAGLAVGAALDLGRLRAPDGCPWDREQTHESLRGHLLEEAYEVYDAMAGRHARARRRAGRPVAPGRAARAAGGRGGRLRPVRRPAAIGPRSSAAIRTCSGTPRRGPRATSTASGSGSRRTSARRPAAEAETSRRIAAGRPRRCRRPATGSAVRCRRWPPARRCRSGPRTWATTGPTVDGILDKVAEETGRAAAAATDQAERARSSATS